MSPHYYKNNGPQRAYNQDYNIFRTEDGSRSVHHCGRHSHSYTIRLLPCACRIIPSLCYRIHNRKLLHQPLGKLPAFFFFHLQDSPQCQKGCIVRHQPHGQHGITSGNGNSVHKLHRQKLCHTSSHDHLYSYKLLLGKVLSDFKVL